MSGPSRRKKGAAAASSVPAPNTRLSTAELSALVEYGIPDIYKWEDDDLALRAAAQSARLPFDKMSSVELAIFRELADSKASLTLYIYIRNKILQMWHLEPNVELTKEAVYNELTPPYNSDQTLTRRIHSFCERFGFINYGIYYKLSAKLLMPHKRIIVVGAGVAGLIAFRQLQSFGFDVCLVEARNRKGGRINGQKGKVSSVEFESGASVLMGLQGNPIMTLFRQTALTLERVNTNSAIYDHEGKLINKKNMLAVEKVLSQLRTTASYIAHEKKVEEMDGEKLSLGSTYDKLICLMEMKLQRERLQFWESYEEVAKKLEQTMEEMLIYKRTGELISEKLDDLAKNPLKFGSELEREILRKCYRRELATSIEKYEQADKRHKGIETALENLKQLQPSDVFMTPNERRLLDFHFAKLELDLGTALKNVSLRDWDQDEAYEFAGSSTTVREGLSYVFSTLVPYTAIDFNQVVKKISYNEEGVTVLTRNTVHDDEKEWSGDAVLVTLPLGVLKASVSGGDENAPTFEPPLPPTKAAAIQRMGFGSLNKIILIFETIFWDKKANFFGHVDAHCNATTRGELFMFEATKGKPVLTAFLAGAAAEAEAPKSFLVGRAMKILAAIFGESCPAKPVEAVVVLWHKDPFSRGSFSYMAKEAQVDDLDRLAEPVKARRLPEGSYDGPQRVFFAGEHTSRLHPATVHGAFLSGLREAGRIANTFFGCPYSSPEEGIITLDGDDEIMLD